MNEYAQIVKTGFSTADAEFPTISQDEGVLTLSFIDWKEENITVQFEDFVVYKWQGIELFVKGEEYDQCHEIINSSWLQAHYDQGVIATVEKHKHFKFNFNAYGQFEVIAKNYKTKA